MTDTILLRADRVSAGYSAGAAGDILRGVSFVLREGERLAIIGPNGSGKTTLLRVLAGALPYRGSVRQLIRDESSPRFGSEAERSSLGAREAARETGYLSQLSSSWFPFSVRDVVMLGRYARQSAGINPKPSAADRSAVASAMDACGVSDIADRTLAELSGGQLQRVFLARTLAQEPSVILLDEPTNHLDLKYQIELLDLVAEKTHEGKDAERQAVGNRAVGAIGVFHDLSLACRFANTVLLLDGGEIAAFGSPREVMGGDEINAAYGMNVAATVRSLLQNWQN
jgi:iron complex transport system ATP-binding protein